jgi:hypothetical protein
VSEAEAAAFGLTVEEASGPPVEVWPDNVDAINLFLSIATQWRTGMAGATGLDYNVLYHKMDRMKLSDERYDELEQEIRVIEDAALDAMRKEK